MRFFSIALLALLAVGVIGGFVLFSDPPEKWEVFESMEPGDSKVCFRVGEDRECIIAKAGVALSR